MTHGRNICNQLKAVRRSIAEENNIPLEVEECTYKGECRGTCPRCEAEVRYLEGALSERIKLGKVATIAGIALGLATTAQAQAPATIPVEAKLASGHEVSLMANSVTIRGIIRDMKTMEEIPFCRIHLIDTRTGIDIDTVMDNGFHGDFALRVPKGEYRVYINHVGYFNYAKIMVLDKDTDLGAIYLEQGYVRTITVGGCEAIPIPRAPEGHEEYYQGLGNTTIVVR